MSRRKRYRKKTLVTAVQLDMHTDGFEFRKWGAKQWCRAGDWIVHGDSDTYTVSKQSFANTYAPVEGNPGRYRKTSLVWAESALEAGFVTTQEGRTHYEEGDYLVCNDEDCSDQYAIAKERFERMYEPVD